MASRISLIYASWIEVGQPREEQQNPVQLPPQPIMCDKLPVESWAVTVLKAVYLRGNCSFGFLTSLFLSRQHRLTMETLSTDLTNKASIGQTKVEGQEDHAEQHTAAGTASGGAKKNKKNKKPATATGRSLLQPKGSMGVALRKSLVKHVYGYAVDSNSSCRNRNEGRQA